MTRSFRNKQIWIWAAFIFIIHVAPVDTERVNRFDFPFADKWIHAILFFLLAGVSLLARDSKRSVRNAGIIIAVACASYGAFLEWTHVKERDRESRAREMVERLQRLGLAITWDDVRAAAEFNIGRPHVADALVEAGAATSRKDAFDRWIGNDCPGYVPSGKTEPTEIIERVVEAGGVISLAHPYSLKLGPDALDAYVQRLADAGLCAIEAHRPDQDPATQAAYQALAQRHGLLVSTGSDFHDLEREEARLRPLGGSGTPGISDDDVEALLSRLPGARDALAA